MARREAASYDLIRVQRFNGISGLGSRFFQEVVEEEDTAAPDERREHQDSRRRIDNLTKYTLDTFRVQCAFRKLEKEDSGVLKHCTDLVNSSFGSLSKLLPRISFMSVTHDWLPGRL
ncbi:hypothetical protein E2C01_055030 [Portunus trituberculatus]|uniref:Uncharacterized protein n=1 Tax=Portunus trituberculatus TaxID=210409 RepID=A0A5B7GVH8_PORTR|nr:hypothetical protein [Portunus trituberculatus]